MGRSVISRPQDDRDAQFGRTAETLPQNRRGNQKQEIGLERILGRLLDGSCAPNVWKEQSAS